jgi:hypothetical protein
MLLARPHRICLQDLEFLQVHVPMRTDFGVGYTRIERVGVPKIPPNILKSVFYLYETEADARAGHNPGGTGFIVAWSKAHYIPEQFYAVTNWHVAVREEPDNPPCPVIRINAVANKTEVIPLRPENWHFLPGGPDIAVAPIEIDHSQLEWSYIPTGMFAIPSDIQYGYVAVGDDVFMVGLFVDHGGEAVNVPSSRFGNISVLPTPFAKIRQETGLEAPSYIVDMHSRSGFSGSPVFMYRTPGQDLTTPADMQFRLPRYQMTRDDLRITSDTIFKFLGIHFGQFAEEWERGEPGANRAENRKRGLIDDGAYVIGWSGMTTVMPAWFILEVIEHHPELAAMRRKKAQRAGVKYPRSEGEK